MCGLAGTAEIGRPELPPEAREVLHRMGRAVAHRGPDGERVVVDGPVGLAFRRLALVDPNGGEQPFTNGDGSIVLMANGEIYNHRDLEAGLPPGTRLRTKSDCEVLVHLYERDGLRFLDNVLGMFAIVLWDRRNNRLVFARDRFGIKPLYYSRNGSALSFASEIKSLFADPRCPRVLDWAAALADPTLTAAPAFARVPVTSWFSGVEVVPAGTIVSVDLGTGRIDEHVYWRLPVFDGDSAASDEEFVRRYRELLDLAVADCASADAEVGLFLSGGVDSAAVAALAARRGPLHTFTVLSGSTLANGDAESAHRVANVLGLPNHQLLFDRDRVPEPDEWKRLLWLLETPLCTPEAYYKYELYRLVKQTRPELKGMLLGQASDEFNGGYSAEISGGEGWDAFEGALRDLARAEALRARPALSPWWDDQSLPLLRDDVLARHTASLADPYDAFVAWKYRDIQQYNCWHEDRTAAGNGIEARVPFLDHRIVELMASVPAARRAALLWDKRILREAVADLLPEDIVRRDKVAFYHGEHAAFTHRTFVRMLAADGGRLLDEALSGPSARDWLDADGMRVMLAELDAGPASPQVERLLRLVNLGLLDAMTAELPVLPVEAGSRELPPLHAPGDWDAGREALVERLCSRPYPSPGDVVAFRDGVLLVQAPAEPEVWYVAIDGQFEYVVDETEEPEWCAFLRAVDGITPLAGVLAAAGTDLAAIGDFLRDALDAALLVPVPTEPTSVDAGELTGAAP